ncbi:hypothetical protein BVX95_00770 [archaeon D22]|nr:hypothetical protein BVX95_00770 [archaeon D22]
MDNEIMQFILLLEKLNEINTTSAEDVKQFFEKIEELAKILSENDFFQTFNIIFDIEIEILHSDVKKCLSLKEASYKFIKEAPRFLEEIKRFTRNNLELLRDIQESTKLDLTTFIQTIDNEDFDWDRIRKFPLNAQDVIAVSVIEKVGIDNFMDYYEYFEKPGDRVAYLLLSKDKIPPSKLPKFRLGEKVFYYLLYNGFHGMIIKYIDSFSFKESEKLLRSAWNMNHRVASMVEERMYSHKKSFFSKIRQIFKSSEKSRSDARLFVKRYRESMAKATEVAKKRLLKEPWMHEDDFLAIFEEELNKLNLSFDTNKSEVIINKDKKAIIDSLKRFRYFYLALSSLRNKYTPEQLFEKLFEFPPDIFVRYEFSQAAVTFICPDKTYDRIYKKLNLNNQKLTKEEIEKMSKYSGGSKSIVVCDDWQIPIVVLRLSHDNINTRMHENQHVENNISYINEEDMSVQESASGFFTNIEKISSEEQKEIFLRFMRKYRSKHIEPRAKDEILAYYRNEPNPNRIEDILLESSLYDYSKEIREDVKYAVGQIFNPLLEDFYYSKITSDKRILELFKDCIREVFKDEYEHLISTSVWSGYSIKNEIGVDRAINLLVQHTLANWEKIFLKYYSRRAMK